MSCHRFLLDQLYSNMAAYLFVFLVDNNIYVMKEIPTLDQE